MSSVKRQGDAKARAWLSRYLLGNPADLEALMAATLDQEART
jgi:hypothetical protein